MIARSVLVRAQCTRLQWRSHSPRPNGRPMPAVNRQPRTMLPSSYPLTLTKAHALLTYVIGNYALTSKKITILANDSPTSIIHGNNVRFGPVSRCAFYPKTSHRNLMQFPIVTTFALTAFALTTPSDLND